MEASMGPRPAMLSVSFSNWGNPVSRNAALGNAGSGNAGSLQADSFSRGNLAVEMLPVGRGPPPMVPLAAERLTAG
ncbi:UNVERIFIED_CONTAM: hypothetical protein FKN15_062813 [Acipenser sinensis]